MPEILDPETAPPLFRDAVAGLRAAQMRPELVITEIPAPAGLAPYAVALAADAAPTRFDADRELATGRLVLLYDPSEPEPWEGAMRLICFAQAPLDLEIATDPFLADVSWSWLVDALDDRGALFAAESGTATKIISTGYGELSSQGSGAKIELRASWSPQETSLAAHAEAWGELLCMLAGLPPVAEGTSSLTAKRNAHG